MIHLYKLTTGETIIANFVRMDEVAVGRYSFVVNAPMLVKDHHTIGASWWPGAECHEMLIPKSSILMMLESDDISESLVTAYKNFTT